MDAPSGHPSLSIVVPAYNEVEVLPALHDRVAVVMESLGESWELVFVNDGSTDDTLTVMQDLHQIYPNVSVISLSRNFGKEIAITAGLDHARGDAVIVLDADLQDPPELIPVLVATWRQGFDTVYAQRRQRGGESWLKKATAHAFYWLMQHVGGVRLPPNTGDFRLMSRRVVTALAQLREQHRFMKGLFAWVGYPSRAVLYDRAPRAAGRSKWSYWKLWNFALEGITSFTVMPLKCATYLGLFIGFFAGIYLCIVIGKTLLLGNPVAGYTSLMAVVLFMGGAQLVTLGVLGEYVGRIFNETKRRPLYFVERHLRIPDVAPTVAHVPAPTRRREVWQSATPDQVAWTEQRALESFGQPHGRHTSIG
jgi:glycosyltransferase involved in cell wall biosynthesis